MPDWSSLKWIGIMVVSGVLTAVAVELVTKRMQEAGVLAARAEVQKLIYAAATEQQKTVAQTPVQRAVDYSTATIF